MDSDLRNISESGKVPASRVLDAASLNAIVTKIISKDGGSALGRQDVQKMWDGEPPFTEQFLRESGQEGRCNLNFGDGKARIKAEEAGYYDLTDSVPTLAFISTDFGDPVDRVEWENIISEEFHRMLKEWPQFDMRFQLLVKKFCGHGVGFLYFKDDVDWRWEVAGLEDFKVPRQTTLSEDECDVAVALRDVTVSKLYSWIKDVEPGDTRWNLKEVRSAMLRASDTNLVYSEGAWEKFQAVLKNNDVYASVTAQEMVRLAHVWVREFSGRISQYLTLRAGGNADFLFKCPGRFDNVNQCFTYFPFETGTNGELHSVRGLAHEIYAQVQVLNTLRCQTVDNARLSGSLLLQPATETDAEDMAIMFYAGAAYLPPNLKVQNPNLANPSSTMLPVIQDMTMLMRRNTSDVPTSKPETQRDKTKFEVQSELTKESVLPTAAMNLFYQPWKRHLTEVWRRTRRKDVLPTDPGGPEILAFVERCKKREVPVEAIYQANTIEPVRAIGFGSPSSRLLAIDEFMQYYGSLDPVGQNNLLRDRFAQKVTYAQVDRYVPRIQAGGRTPFDGEIADLQNVAMSAGKAQRVRPNDNHIMHLQSHLPDLMQDCDNLESGQSSPELLQVAQIKIQHCADHMKLLKPDKLQKDVVASLTKQFNNTSERVQAAMDHAQRAAAKQQQAAAGQPATPPTPEMQQKMMGHQQDQQMRVESHQLTLKLREADAKQKLDIRDADASAKMRAEAAKERFRNAGPVPVAPANAGPPEPNQVVAGPV